MTNPTSPRPSLALIVLEALSPRLSTAGNLATDEFAGLEFEEQMNRLRALLPNVDDNGRTDEPHLDYERLAIALDRLTEPSSPLSPLELAIRDGAQMLQPYVGSLDGKDGIRASAAHEWLNDLTALPHSEELQSPASLRALLSAGHEAVINISHWLDLSDPLRSWLDVAAYPDALSTELDPIGCGMVTDIVHVDDLDLDITGYELENPHAFLKSTRGRAIVDQVLEDCYHVAWQPSDRPLDQKTCTKIAAKVIAYLRGTSTPEERRFAAERALVESFRPDDADDEFHRNAWDAAETIIGQIAGAAGDLDGVTVDEDEWMDAIRDVCVDKMETDDSSKPLDMISSVDRAEIVFHIQPDGYSLDDMCSIDGVHLEPARMNIDHALSHGLAVLGHSVESFRREFKNERPAARGLVEVTPRPDQIITIDQVRELIENSCNTYFQFVAYAYVPLTDLLKLDLNKPVAFSQVAIAAYNLAAGTFHDVIVKREFVVQDGVDGTFQATDAGYSPDDICGLHLPAYYAALFDPEIRDRDVKFTELLKARLAELGLSRSHPGFKVHWEADDEGDDFSATVGVYADGRSYKSLNCRISADGQSVTLS